MRPIHTGLPATIPALYLDLTHQPDLSPGMRHINGVYTQRYNRIHGRVGHLFQGRFKSVLIDLEANLLELCRYLVLNPVRAGRVERPEEYAWSSCRATAGVSPGPEFLSWWIGFHPGSAGKMTRLVDDIRKSLNINGWSLVRRSTNYYPGAQSRAKRSETRC